MINRKMAVICSVVIVVVTIATGVIWTGSPKAETGPNKSGSATDFSIPDIDGPAKGEGVSKEGCIIPSRPEWTKDAPVEDWKKLSLLTEIYELRQRKAIVETQDCSCETKYPSWDTAQSELDEMVAGLSSEEVSALVYDIAKQASKLLKPSLNVCRKVWRN